MDHSDPRAAELEQLRQRVRELETQLGEEAAPRNWPPKGFYWSYYATTGFLLGAVGAITSLLVNVIGAPIAGKSPLELIRVYLTFPLGEQALQITGQEPSVYAIGDGMILAIGCCLYLGTGMLLGVPFFALLVRICGERPGLPLRLAVATGLALILWGVNFYGVLAWLQPALLGGRWITDPAVLPPWVAAATHLVFGWTLALLYPLGQFVPFEAPPPEHAADPHAVAAH